MDSKLPHRIRSLIAAVRSLEVVRLSATRAQVILLIIVQLTMETMLKIVTLRTQNYRYFCTVRRCSEWVKARCQDLRETSHSLQVDTLMFISTLCIQINTSHAAIQRHGNSEQARENRKHKMWSHEQYWNAVDWAS